jgi:hypothetical protein
MNLFVTMKLGVLVMPFKDLFCSRSEADEGESGSEA